MEMVRFESQWLELVGTDIWSNKAEETMMSNMGKTIWIIREIIFLIL